MVQTIPQTQKVHVTATPSLKRSLNLPLLTLYGLGTTIGAGIYVLIGAVAGQAGKQAPFSFLLAAFVAAFTAYSFAQLAIRYPQSAGEAVYVKAAFGYRWLSTVVGLVVAGSSMIAAAAILNGATGYVRLFVTLPHEWVLIGLIFGLGLLAAWGITQSALVAGLFTLIEVIGLFGVVWFGIRGTPDLIERLPELTPSFTALEWNGIIIGSVLAFFAFIGFEDMVNLAEETVDVRKTLPRAIFLTLVISSLLYFVVVTVAVLAVPPERLAESEVPIALIIERGGMVSPKLIGAVTLLATVNGALIQMILASRVFYGLSRTGGLPEILGRVNRITQTPLIATVSVLTIVLVLGLAFPLEELARSTSLLTLAIFGLVNLALVRLELREPSQKYIVRLSLVLPLLGTLVSIGFLVVDLVRLMR